MFIRKSEYEKLKHRVCELKIELESKEKAIARLEREVDELINVPGKAEAMRDLEGRIEAYINRGE